MRGIAACIVTYNPELARFSECLSAVAEQVEHVFVVDNGSNETGGVEALCQEYDNAIFVPLGENKGIAAALNMGCAAAIEKRCTAVLTLDQDSVCEDGLVEKLAAHLTKDVGIAAPWISYAGNEEYYELPQDGPYEVEWTITSASLTSLGAWRKIGGFDEALFIDSVDRDFCIRLRRAGYRVVIDPATSLSHELGDMRCVRILGKVIHITNHSSFRKYYIARNKILLAKKGEISSAECVREISQEFFKALLLEDNKASKISRLMHGIVDGLQSRIGTPRTGVSSK